MKDKFVFLSQFCVNFRKVTLATGVPLSNSSVLSTHIQSYHPQASILSTHIQSHPPLNSVHPHSILSFPLQSLQSCPLVFKTYLLHFILTHTYPILYPPLQPLNFCALTSNSILPSSISSILSTCIQSYPVLIKVLSPVH